MKIVSLFLLCFASLFCCAQFKLINLKKDQLPKDINIPGNIVKAVRWTDSNGDNIVVLSASGKTKSQHAPDDGYTDGSLYAAHFLAVNGIFKQTWKLYDYVHECPVDMFLYFIEDAFTITDLNNNGTAEVWMMYKISCQGDVSPIPMKIIMYEGNKKYAARGTTKVQPAENEFMGGEFSFDYAFNTAPPLFRNYVQALWQKHKVETWQQ